MSPWGRDPHPLLLQHGLLIVPIPAPARLSCRMGDPCRIELLRLGKTAKIISSDCQTMDP